MRVRNRVCVCVRARVCVRALMCVYVTESFESPADLAVLLSGEVGG